MDTSSKQPSRESGGFPDDNHLIDLWNRLAFEYPWPKERPKPPPSKFRGWLNRGTAALLKEHMTPDGTVVELGTWRGLSARRMLSRMGAGRVICIDHWKGSEEHISGCYKDRVKGMLPHLFELFCDDTWEFRDRIIPLRMDTLKGLHIIRHHYIVPDLIYIDASHEEFDVLNDLIISTTLFQRAAIVGDDWYIGGVKRAVRAFCKLVDRYELIHNKKGFCLEPHV